MDRDEPPTGTRRFSGLARRPFALLPLLAFTVLLTEVHWMFGLTVAVVSFLIGRSALSTPLVAAAFLSVVAAAALSVSVDVGSMVGWVGVLAAAVLLLLLPWLLGRHLRDRVDLRVAERQAVEQLHRQQVALAQETRLRERARIAREMHDTLGHELSLLALRAGAVEMGVGTTTGTEARTAQDLREAATRAAEQLTDIVGVLSDDDAGPLRPASEDVQDVVAGAGDAGMRVTLVWDGSDEPMAPMVQRALVRLVREGLTNAAKHAPGAQVRVRVRQGPQTVEVSVADDGAPVTQAPPVSGGRGLVGLQERVRLLGGQVTAGPAAGGFRLAASLPVEGRLLLSRDREEPTHPGDAALRQLELPRLRARRSLVSVLVAPLAILVVAVVALAGYFTFVTVASVLTPGEYAEIHVGQPQSQAEGILPPTEMAEPPVDRLPAPSGAECRYYERAVSFFDREDVYRICFERGVVIATDVIPATTP
jgi:signal transduction histidine kinase